MSAPGTTTAAAVEPERGRARATKEAARSPKREADERAAGAAEGRPLGSTQSNCATPPAEVDRRRVRWAARAALWQASTLYPVRTCGRSLAPVIDRSEGGAVPVERTSVGVKRRETDHGAAAGYSGLTLCGSVWACPRCSAVVAAQRSVEIGRAVAGCHARGGQVHFLTLTLRHRRHDALADLFDVLHAGWRSVVGSSAWSGDRRRIGDRDRFGVAGYVRVIEATVSRPGSGGHGWHLHAHCLLFTVAGLSAGLREDYRSILGDLVGRPVDVDAEWLARRALHARVYARWVRGVTRAGGRVPGTAAVDLVTVADGGAEFVGRYLAKSTYDVAKKLGAEVAAADLTKTPREAANVSPFGLLAELIEEGPRFGIRTPRQWDIIKDGASWAVVNTMTGEVDRLDPPGAWRSWMEWERATTGRRQLAWALRPRRVTNARERLWVDLLGARGEDAEAADEDLARREIGGDLLGSVTRESWYARLVWRPSWLVDLLDAAEQRGAQGVTSWCSSHGVELCSREWNDHPD